MIKILLTGFRIVIRLSLVAGAMYIGIYTAELFQEIAQIQITVYSRFLDGQSSVSEFRSTTNQRIDSVGSFIEGSTTGSQPIPTDHHQESLEKVTTLTKKIKRLSRFLGSITGIIVYHIGSRFVLGINNHIHKLKTYFTQS